MPFPNPTEAADPITFVDALLAEYGPEISEEKFVLMFKEGTEYAKAEGATPISEMQGQMVAMGGDAGIESEKLTEVSNDAIAKVQDIIIPFVAVEIFKWLDRDSSKGVSKDEIMFFASMAMEGQEKSMEVCKSLLWSVLDKNGDGKISSAELSAFVAEILQLAAKVAHCVVDTFSTAFKGDLMQMIVGQAFANLDADNDGFIDEAELQMVKQGLEQLQGELQELSTAEADDVPLPVKLMLEDVKACKAFATEQASGGADLAKVVAFNRTLLDGRMALCKKILDDDETFEEMPIPPAILAKIREFGEPVMAAINKTMDDKLETITKCIFDICDANKDGKLDEDEFLGIAGVMDHERSAEDKFSCFLGLIDTDGDKKVSPDELKEFAGKVFDAGVCGTQIGIDLYADVATVVAARAIAFLLEKLVGGDEVTKEKFDEMLGQVMEDGPECLLGPLMEE
jgi:Ca2+-binding EF-hand superfamily protein